MGAHPARLVAFLCAAWGAHAALSEIPTISMSAAQSEDELDVGPRFTPNQFQYRITRTRETRAYPPWVSDAVMDSVMSPGITCAQYLQKDRIRFRGETGELQEIPLAPVPLEQTWAPDGTKLHTDSPGIQRNRVSSCCDAETCTDRCLLFRGGEPWFLEINAPSWAVYKVTDGYQPEDVAFGFVMLTPQEQIIKKDPGIWPVMRIPCHFCPIKSCITNCSNGEYSSGYADSTVSDPCLPPLPPPKLTPSSVRNPDESSAVQVLPRWNLEYVQGSGHLPMGHPAGLQGRAPGTGHPHFSRRPRYCMPFLIPSRPVLTVCRSGLVLSMRFREPMHGLQPALRGDGAGGVHRHHDGVEMPRYRHFFFGHGSVLLLIKGHGRRGRATSPVLVQRVPDEQGRLAVCVQARPAPCRGQLCPVPGRLHVSRRGAGAMPQTLLPAE